MDLLKTVQFKEARKIGKKVYDDKVFSESLRKQVEGGRGLSVNQIRYLDRMVMKYGDQIPNFESLSVELGLGAEEAADDQESGPLLEVLKNIKEWKPAVMRGKREWDDQKFYDSLSRQFEQKKQLSDRQRISLKKLASRYSAQIPEYEQVREKFNLPVRKAKAQE